MASTMTPLCGFGMGEGGTGGGEPAQVVPRHKQSVSPVNGATVQMDTADGDGMLLLMPAVPLESLTLVLPATGPDLEMYGLASMLDIVSITFIGGEVKNAPTELLANQAVLIQRIDPATNTWISIL